MDGRLAWDVFNEGKGRGRRMREIPLKDRLRRNSLGESFSVVRIIGVVELRFSSFWRPK